MNNSYIEEIKNGFPEIQRPFTEEQLARFEANCALQPQTKYVAKSERMQELEKELEVVKELTGKVNKAVDCWVLTKNGRTKTDYRAPSFTTPNLPYKKYKTDGTFDAVNDCIDPLKKTAFMCADRMGKATLALQQTLVDAREDLERNIEIEQKGLAGENTVEAYIRRKLDCRVLSSVILPGVQESADAPKTAETDLLVISDTGVYVCEVKNYGKAGQTLDVQPNGQIIKRDYYGRELENMGSPFAQNARHTKAVKRVLAAAGMENAAVYSVVIIANTDVTVDNSSNYIVTDMYGFCDIATKGFYGVTCTAEQQSAIFNAIQAKRMTERKFPCMAISPLAETIICTCIEAKDALQRYGQWEYQTQERIDEWTAEVVPIWIGNNYKQLSYYNYYSFREEIRKYSMITCLIAFLVMLVGAIASKSIHTEIAEFCGILGAVCTYKAIWSDVRKGIGADESGTTFAFAVVWPSIVLCVASILPAIITLLFV